MFMKLINDLSMNMWTVQLYKKVVKIISIFIFSFNKLMTHNYYYFLQFCISADNI